MAERPALQPRKTGYNESAMESRKSKLEALIHQAWKSKRWTFVSERTTEGGGEDVEYCHYIDDEWEKHLRSLGVKVFTVGTVGHINTFSIPGFQQRAAEMVRETARLASRGTLVTDPINPDPAGRIRVLLLDQETADRILLLGVPL